MKANFISFTMDGFMHLEPRLKEWFGIDRNNQYIQEVFLNRAGERMKDAPDIDKYKNEKGCYDVNAYAEAHFNELKKEKLFMKMPANTRLHTIEKFCVENQLGITEEDDAYQVLLYAYVLLMKDRSKSTEEATPFEDTFYEYNEYIHAVRPDMLKLYIGRHKGNRQYHKQCRISFGNFCAIKVDEKTPWFQDALDSYMEKYLGVKSVKEAEQELYAVYGKTVGAKMNVSAVRYMWGTYHLLQTIPKYKSKKEKSVTRKQSRIIADLLNRLGLIGYKEGEVFDDYTAGERIRPLLNSYLTQYNSIDEIIKARRYKTSPNNKDDTRYY